MALVLSYEDAKANQGRIEGDGSNAVKGVLATRFFGSRKNPDPEFPHATLGQPDPGRISNPHFHIRDQFQVIIDGKGKLGRHDLAPYCIHFSRAYTPYGPLASDPRNPFTVFTLRAHYDPGSQRLPKERDKLAQIPNRQPWQITRTAAFPSLQSGTNSMDVNLQEIAGIKDENGLAAYTLSMKPNSKTRAPNPSVGDGQYLVVVKGSLLHESKEHKAWALVFVYAKEDPFSIYAGPAGLEALVLNFPRPLTPAASTVISAPATGFRT